MIHFYFSVSKIVKFRFWAKEDQPWKTNILETDFKILLVSQFTLYANVNKGSKPDFHHAMKSEESINIFNSFVSLLKSKLPERVESSVLLF